MGSQFVIPVYQRTYTWNPQKETARFMNDLEDLIEKDRRFVFAAVKGDYGDKLPAFLDHIVLIEVPREVLSRRVRDRSYQKFGDRVLPGGDLYEKEQKWYALTDSRPDDYVTQWLDTVRCPVTRIDGTLPVEENLSRLLSILA